MIPFYKAAMRVLFLTSAFLLTMFWSASCCYGSDLVVIHSNRIAPAELEGLQTAAGFYGLHLRDVTLSSDADKFSIQTAIEAKETVGVVIDAAALSSVDEGALLRFLNHRAGGDIPLMILGIGPNLSPELLKAWSGGKVTQCIRIESSPESRYIFGRVDRVTGQLAGLDVPSPVRNAFYSVLDDDGGALRIESLGIGGKTLPLFSESKIGQQTVFLAGAAPEEGGGSKDPDVVGVFFRTTPEMMFAKYCAGERGWHSLHYYANFTIDDPWLREPYGYVDYDGLLGEMEKHRFHTTIAFIPWNYERSQPEVASLFRDHPDKFSITVHGNDHDHKEFTDYGSKPLALQVGDMKQSLARMERFRTLTGISYDNVMIFPHSIAPEQTLGALKTYNYWATVNASNIPQSSTRSASASDVLRPVTLAFDGFPSISRYSAGVGVPEAYVAINQFLGNPLFFYDHSDLFAKGIDAFDPVADTVNRLEPTTEWRGLGEIVRHLYVIRLRDDSNYDVLAFSNHICLENPTGRNLTYYIQKQESGGQKIGSVTVDGRVHPYTFQDGNIRLGVPVSPGSTSCVAIQYVNDFRLGSIDPAHDSAIVYLLRMGSDFRDIYLAKSSAGLAMIRFYNEHALTPVQVIACLLLLLVVVIFAGWRLRASLRYRLNPIHPGRPAR